VIDPPGPWHHRIVRIPPNARSRSVSLLLGFASALGCTPADDSGLDAGMTTTTAGNETETAEDTSSAEQTTAEGEEDDEPECVDNSDCPQYSYCSNGMCVNGEEPEVDECTEHEDCPEGLCIEYECVPGALVESCEPIELATTEVFTLSPPYDFDVGNVDGQPGDEIVAYHQYEIVSVAAGMPTISAHPVPYGGVRDVVILQADGDGAADLMMAGTTGATGLHTFLGDGTGTFSYLGVRHFDDEIRWLARAIAASADVLVGDHHVFLDALALAPTLTLASGANPTTGDLDGDGIDELAILNGYDVEIWAREGDSFVLAATLDCYFDGFYYPAPVLGDVDADGLDDVVCLADSEDATAVSWWSRSGGLELTRQPTVYVEPPVDGSGGERTGVVADLQGDGAPELVLTTGIFLQLGDDGNFGCQGNLGLEFEQAGDLDDDGRADLVSVDWNDVVWSHEAL
jgi:hypothetical protein